MIYFVLIFCGIILLIFCMLLLYLILQTKSYVKISADYTNRYLNCEISLEEYNRLRIELQDGVNPLLRWYMKKVGVSNAK